MQRATFATGAAGCGTATLRIAPTHEPAQRLVPFRQLQASETGQNSLPGPLAGPDNFKMSSRTCPAAEDGPPAAIRRSLTCLQPHSQAVHPQCSRRKDHRRREGRYPEGERCHSSLLPRRKRRPCCEVHRTTPRPDRRCSENPLSADHIHASAGATT
jgi:hypothetical protein